MSIYLVTLLLFGLLALFLMLGLPVAFSLGSTAMVFALWLWGPDSLYMFATKMWGTMSSFILIAVPMFIFMAMMLERSGVAEDLYSMMHHWLGGLRGGLAIGTVLVCTIFAAMSGISATATTTMSLIAMPAMFRRGYHKHIVVGCIAGGGALGVLIPPSVIMIVYAVMAQASVGQLFFGGVIPGLILSAMFILYIGIICYLRPEMGPPLPPGERAHGRQKLMLLVGIILPVILIITVLGSIFTGICTPTEASALGAIGSLVCSAVKRRLSWKSFNSACLKTFGLSAMCLWISISAYCLSAVYNGIGGMHVAEGLVGLNLPFGRWGVIILIQIVLIFLGCFLDPMSIMFIIVPICAPLVASLGFDLVWFGVLFVVNMEMSYLTPPFGFNLFYIRSVAPPEVSMADIYRSIPPFVVIQAISLILCMVFPQIILWLPSLMIK